MPAIGIMLPPAASQAQQNICPYLGADSERKNVVIIKDLILAHTAEEVYPIYADTYAVLRIPELNDEQNRRAYFFDFYEYLKNIEPIPGNTIVLGHKSSWDGHEHIDTTFCDVGAVGDNFQPKSILSVINTDSVEELSIPLIVSLQLELEMCFPAENDTLYYSWAEMLGIGIPEVNLHSIGELPMLARLLLEISAYGFTEKESEAERQELICELESDSDEDDDDDDDEEGEDDDLAGYDEYDGEDEPKRPVLTEELFNDIHKYNALGEYYNELRRVGGLPPI